jgi:hypothetical protein
MPGLRDPPAALLERVNSGVWQRRALRALASRSEKDLKQLATEALGPVRQKVPKDLDLDKLVGVIARAVLKTTESNSTDAAGGDFAIDDSPVVNFTFQNASDTAAVDAVLRNASGVDVSVFPGQGSLQGIAVHYLIIFVLLIMICLLIVFGSSTVQDNIAFFRDLTEEALQGVALRVGRYLRSNRVVPAEPGPEPGQEESGQEESGQEQGEEQGPRYSIELQPLQQIISDLDGARSQSTSGLRPEDIEFLPGAVRPDDADSDAASDAASEPGGGGAGGGAPPAFSAGGAAAVAAMSALVLACAAAGSLAGR